MMERDESQGAHLNVTGIQNLAGRIQHTLISNRVSKAQWESHIGECLRFHVNAAMVPPCWVRATRKTFEGTGIRTASWIDFPFGTMTSAGKAFEARRLIEEGAEEIDLMPNLGFLASGMEEEYFHDIAGVVQAAQGAPVKVVLELPLLSPSQKRKGIELSVRGGATYLKNVSGGAVGVASPEDIRFLRAQSPPHVRIKASGGIKTAKQAFELLEAGADLIGTSSAIEILEGSQAEGGFGPPATRG